MDIDFDKVYDCINPEYGSYKIIEDLGRIIVGHTKGRYVKIKFTNTGNEKIARIDHALSGSIRDTMKNIDFDKDYESKRCGKFRIIKILPNEGTGRVRMVQIRFNDTGYTRSARLEHVITGNVIDCSIPQTHNIGWYGYVEQSHYEIRHWYKIWSGIISRCYNKSSSSYISYGAKGVTVDKHWHVFSNFLEDIQYLPGYPEACKNPSGYHLDKDYLQRHLPHSQRVYSKDTCMFLTQADNEGIKSINYDIKGNYTVVPVKITPELKPMVTMITDK
jgi:hypothetical protein